MVSEASREASESVALTIGVAQFLVDAQIASLIGNVLRDDNKNSLWTKK